MKSHRITSHHIQHHIISCHVIADRSKYIQAMLWFLEMEYSQQKNKIIGTICVYYGESNGFGLPNRLGTANSIQYSSYHVYIYNWGSSTYIRLDLIKTSSSNQGHSRISQLLHWTPGLSNMLALCGSFNNCGHLKNWMIWGLGNLQICSYDHLCSRSWNPQL